MEQYHLDTQCVLKYFGPKFRIITFSFVFVSKSRITYHADPDQMELSDLGLYRMLMLLRDTKDDLG